MHERLESRPLWGQRTPFPEGVPSQNRLIGRSAALGYEEVLPRLAKKGTMPTTNHALASNDPHLGQQKGVQEIHPDARDWSRCFLLTWGSVQSELNFRLERSDSTLAID